MCYSVGGRVEASVCLHLEHVDRFKQWDDNFGHAGGDALLRELAVVLRAAAADLVVRNGGDEFCVVFDDAEKSSAIERAERLRASNTEAGFSGLHAHGSGAQEVTISASIGVASFPVGAESPSALLEKTDEAMYHRSRRRFLFQRRWHTRADSGTAKRTIDCCVSE
jgi:diguanylate cyclase (GGDEF)-like protein